MTERDPLLERLAELPPSEPDAVFSEKLRERAHRVLRPRRVHPIWTLAAAASVVVYLGWAVYFTSRLY
jgi:type VI protein secretion system component VasF